MDNTNIVNTDCPIENITVNEYVCEIIGINESCSDEDIIVNEHAVSTICGLENSINLMSKNGENDSLSIEN